VRRLPLGFITSVALVIAAYFAFYEEYELLTRTQAAYATGIVLLGALPLLVRAANKREATLMPLMPLSGLFYASTFGVPTLSAKTLWYGSDEASITQALLLTNIGLVCLYVGYYSSRRLHAAPKPLHFLARADPHQQSAIAWSLFGMSLFFELVPTLRSLPSVGQLSEPLSYLSLGILFVMVLEGQLRGAQRIALVVAVAFTVAARVLSGSLAGPVFVLVFLAVLYWNHSHRIPWHFIAVGATIAILLNPVKGTFRRNTWFADTPVTSYYDKARVFYEAAEQEYSDVGVATFFREDIRTVNRLAHSAVFSVVVGMTPDPVPFWMGGSYKTLWTSFIPRVLYPDKPRATIGQEFGHRYSLIGDEDEVTSINLPWLPEFYANFGRSGVLLGMFGVGLFFRFLVEKFNVPRARRIEYVLGITITFSLFYAESNFSLMVGGVLLTYLALLVLLRLLATTSAIGRRRPSWIARA
jgi:hypothetical protein